MKQFKVGDLVKHIIANWSPVHEYKKGLILSFSLNSIDEPQALVYWFARTSSSRKENNKIVFLTKVGEPFDD